MKHGCPPAATKSKYGKISKSQILTQPHPQGHVMSVKCEQPLDELTVQVRLLYDHPIFKYCTLNVSGTELRRDKRVKKSLTLVSFEIILLVEKDDVDKCVYQKMFIIFVKN